MIARQTLLITFVSCIFVRKAFGHLLTIQPHQEECFHEELSQASKAKFTFEVFDGGSLDIDLTIKDPSNNIIHQEYAKSSGRYTIEANQGGTHTYCFGNKHSSPKTKILMFDIKTAEMNANQNKKEHDKLQDMVTELGALMTGVKHEMDFLAARDRLHRNISERVNSRVMIWSIFELLLVISVAYGQTIFLKRFFETRRMA